MQPITASIPGPAPVLTVMVLVPLAGALLLWFVPPLRGLARGVGLVFSLGALGVGIWAMALFDPGSGGTVQLAETRPWIPTLGISWALGVNALGLAMLLLAAFLVPLVLLAGWGEIPAEHQALFTALVLALEAFVVVIFSARDVFLFYVCFEAMLVPVYVLIGRFGGPDRRRAALKFLLYSLAGGLVMLVGVVALFFYGPRTETGYLIGSLAGSLSAPPAAARWIFASFMIAFAIKAPLVPLHTWLPDAHVEAPTGGSMVLAAITLKLGAYGFLRFILPILPDASRYFAPAIIVLSLIAVIYIGMVALAQTDMKKLVAYSSISHMGFVTLGMFLFTNQVQLQPWALKGAIMQMISHGFVSAAMFFCIGVMYDRLHSRNIADYGGVVTVMPKFAAFMMLFAMANAGLPATSGFVGEFMVIMGAVNYNLFVGALAALTLILGAAYTLWMYKRVIFGAVSNPHVAEMKDINRREFAILAILAAAVLGMGLWPEPFIAVVHQAANDLIAHVAQSKI